MSWEIKCGNCGERSPFYRWIEDHRLPSDYYRCPKCNVVIRRTEGPPQTINLPDSQTIVIPGEIKLERVSMNIQEAYERHLH